MTVKLCKIKARYNGDNGRKKNAGDTTTAEHCSRDLGRFLWLEQKVISLRERVGDGCGKNKRSIVNCRCMCEIDVCRALIF